MLTSFYPDLMLAELNTRLSAEYTSVNDALLAFLQAELSSSSKSLPDLINAWLVIKTSQTGATSDLLRLHVGPATTIAEGAALGPELVDPDNWDFVNGAFLTNGIITFPDNALNSASRQTILEINKRYLAQYTLLTNGGGSTGISGSTTTHPNRLTLDTGLIELEFIHDGSASGEFRLVSTTFATSPNDVSVREILPTIQPLTDRMGFLLAAQTFFA